MLVSILTVSTKTTAPSPKTMNKTTLDKLQQASHILETASVAGEKEQTAFQKAIGLVGADMAWALLVAIKRAEYGSLELHPQDPGLSQCVEDEIKREGYIKSL